MSPLLPLCFHASVCNLAPNQSSSGIFYKYKDSNHHQKMPWLCLFLLDRCYISAATRRQTVPNCGAASLRWYSTVTYFIDPEKTERHSRPHFATLYVNHSASSQFCSCYIENKVVVAYNWVSPGNVYYLKSWLWMLLNRIFENPFIKVIPTVPKCLLSDIVFGRSHNSMMKLNILKTVRVRFRGRWCCNFQQLCN